MQCHISLSFGCWENHYKHPRNNNGNRSTEKLSTEHMYCVIKADRKYPVTELIHTQAEQRSYVELKMWTCRHTPQRLDCCLQLQIFWTKYCDMQRFNIQFTMPPALKEPCAKILIRVISRLMALWRASSCLGRALFQVSFPPQFERFPLFLFLNFSFTFLPILNSTTSSIASFAPNLHFANASSASPRLYPNSQTNIN